MTGDTNTLSYWLNWRFLLCAIWLITTIVAAVFILLKYEGFSKKRTQRRDCQEETVGSLYNDEAWRTCLKVIHPGWLLAYRLIAFSLLLALIIANVVIDGAGIFYFYTQWTFSLVTIYFGLGSSLSIYGCCQYRNEVGGNTVDRVGLDPERGTYVALTLGENTNPPSRPVNLNSHVESHVNKIAGMWGYGFQILFQVCAGAVMLTDSVYWFIIYPFLTADDFKLDFLVVSMHSINAVFLFGDMILNSLQFPFFRLAYFALWTSVFVIFQWILHACISMWWPYPFLDLSSPFAPIWYLGVGLLHIPCYAIVSLIFKTKQVCLSRYTKTLRSA